MSITIEQLARYYQNTDPNESAKTCLKRILVQSLAPREHDVYEAITVFGLETAAEIADHLGLKVNNVGNILKRLTGYGLIERRPVVDQIGIHFVYSIKLDAHWQRQMENQYAQIR